MSSLPIPDFFAGSDGPIRPEKSVAEFFDRLDTLYPPTLTTRIVRAVNHWPAAVSAHPAVTSLPSSLWAYDDRFAFEPRWTPAGPRRREPLPPAELTWLSADTTVLSLRSERPLSAETVARIADGLRAFNEQHPTA